jgi:hypothetical protein
MFLLPAVRKRGRSSIDIGMSIELRPLFLTFFFLMGLLKKGQCRAWPAKSRCAQRLVVGRAT